MSSLRSRFALFLVSLLAVAASARATTVIPPDFDRLVSHAQAIFEGEVTNVQSQWIGEGSQHRIVSFVTFKVDDSLKGNLGATYTIRMLGGTVDGQTLEVTDAPKFQKGDHDLLFVENNGSQFVPLVGIGHGRFRIQKDENGNDILATGAGQPLADVNQLGHDEKEMSQGRRPLTLDEFKSTIRQRIQQLGNKNAVP